MATIDPDAMPPLPSGVSPNPTVPAQDATPAPATKRPTCTHMTMTRLYSKEFRCAVCLQESSFGWFYRCTQDRELILEDNAERGFIEKFDNLGEVFERPTSPPSRGPAARQNPAAFLKELTEDQIKTYSRDQLNTILAQRIRILETAARQTAEVNLSAGIVTTPSRSTFSNVSPSKSPAKSANKPWMLLSGGECQFKCCHRCRPSSKERSFLNLNGIVDGILPMTAVTGFGFHLQGYRPVLKAEIVKSLGLRDSPPRSKSPDSTTWSFSDLSTALTSPNKPQHDLTTVRKNTFAGLGLISSDDSAQPTNPRSPPGLPIPTYSPLQNITAIGNGSAHDPSIPKAFTDVIQSKPELCQNTNSLVVRIRSPNNVSPKNVVHEFDRSLPCLLGRESSSALSLMVDTRLPEISDEEVDHVRQPCTPMEMVEAKTGWFGSKPLVVRDGVAVTEEGVEGHFADLKIDGSNSYLGQL